MPRDGTGRLYDMICLSLYDVVKFIKVVVHLTVRKDIDNSHYVPLSYENLMLIDIFH